MYGDVIANQLILMRRKKRILLISNEENTLPTNVPVCAAVKIVVKK